VPITPSLPMSEIDAESPSMTIKLVAATSPATAIPAKRWQMQQSIPQSDHYVRGMRYTMIDLIRRLATGFVYDGWLPLMILGVVVFWMMRSA
jgi:hypothetical protein